MKEDTIELEGVVNDVLPDARSPGKPPARAKAASAEPRTDILGYLKKHGQRLDSEIARDLAMPLSQVRERVALLAVTGAVITCSLTRFEDGKPVEARQIRVSGYTPPVAPGRKPGTAS